MITTIIFSFNRAIQLEKLLESIYALDTNRQLEINILFKYSNLQYLKGYEKLKDLYTSINWYEEKTVNDRFVGPNLKLYWRNYYWWLKYNNQRWVKSDFKKLLLTILRSRTNENVMFLTDDSFFFRNIEINPEVIRMIKQKPYDISYSLRFGKNIYGGEFINQNNFLKWNRNDQHPNKEWAYPFSVDGHIYNSEIITRLMTEVRFSNPNTFEANLSCYCREKKLFCQSYSNIYSCLIGTELNRVQQVNKNDNMNINIEQLNKLYLEGYKLEIKYILSDHHMFRPPIDSIYAYKLNKRIYLFRSNGS